MNFDDLQKAWQSQDPGAKMTIDVDALLKEVRRNHQQFVATIFLRDVRAVSVCALMMLFFLAWGLWWQWWSFYLLSFCCFFVGAFFWWTAGFRIGGNRSKVNRFGPAWRTRWLRSTIKSGC
jgi:hypothetical protein